MDDREFWEEVPDFPNYLVSTNGDVYNMRHRRSLQLQDHSGGYYKVCLYNENGRQEFLVHQLVAICFLASHRPNVRIKHIDGNGRNNRIDNLELTGTKRIRRFGTPVRGGRVQIVETKEIFVNAYACARYLNGDPGSIYKCLRQERKTHLGYHYEYVL